jgi:hypothetical protein
MNFFHWYRDFPSFKIEILRGGQGRLRGTPNRYKSKWLGT